jgi:hypothetical protein
MQLDSEPSVCPCVILVANGLGSPYLVALKHVICGHDHVKGADVGKDLSAKRAFQQFRTTRATFPMTVELDSREWQDCNYRANAWWAGRDCILEKVPERLAKGKEDNQFSKFLLGCSFEKGLLDVVFSASASSVRNRIHSSFPSAIEGSF